MNRQDNLHFYSDHEVEWKQQKFTRKVSFTGINREGELLIGKAECSEKDIFDKTLGRKISTGRANKKPILTIQLKPDAKITDLFIDACKQHLNEN